MLISSSSKIPLSSPLNMETTTLAKTKVWFDHGFPPPSKAHRFLIANGINYSDPPFQIAGIEMVALQSVTYTSLKDLLPGPAIATSPTYDRRDSWREIPMKDPLLQHAAWAYLQPASTPRKAKGRTKVMDRCVGIFGCFGGFFNDVVSMMIKRWFRRNENVGDDADCLTAH